MTPPQKVGTIMILDDEEFDQKMYRRLLERSGLVETVLSFTYPQEALDFLAEPGRQNIDILLLDINLPGMNGFEFLDKAIEKFGEDFAQSIVIMLTTSLDPQDEERARKFHVVKDYINKPLMRDHIERICSAYFKGVSPD